MAFLTSPAVLRSSFLATKVRILTSRRPLQLATRRVRYRPISAVSTDASSSPSPPSSPTSEPPNSLYACVNCGAELPHDLSGTACQQCGEPYRQSSSGYYDFLPPSTDNPMIASVSRPVSVSLFQSPVVAWLYERGWRDNFARAGFPGPDAEAQLARTFFNFGHAGNGDYKILDVSCGSGIMTRRIDADVALDYSGAMLREAISRDRNGYKSKKRMYVRADVSNMPFQDASFDGVTAGAALHCWPLAQDALLEVRRVLKPGGKFFATTFARDAYVGNRSLARFLQPSRATTTYRFFWPEELVWLCKAARFSVVDVQCTKSFVTVRCQK